MTHPTTRPPAETMSRFPVASFRVVNIGAYVMLDIYKRRPETETEPGDATLTLGIDAARRLRSRLTEAIVFAEVWSGLHDTTPVGDTDGAEGEA